MASPLAFLRRPRAFVVSAAGAFAALLALGASAARHARAEEPPPAAEGEGKEPARAPTKGAARGPVRGAGAVCAAGWATSGAARTRRSRLRVWRVKLDVPRASGPCADALEHQILDELARALPPLATDEHPADADCRLAYARGDDLAWACHLRWRGERPGPLAAVVGLSASGAPDGLRFRAALATCGADARRAIYRDAVEALTPRVREAANEALRAQPALLSAYRDGETLRVSFGRAMPQEDTSTTVARVPWETVATLCGAQE